ncbi:MAG: hypothetical protein E7277_00455 [Lachnospiraceae bacterium]|nr:hypothetical protein [Lachnospiraceae bacterium]
MDYRAMNEVLAKEGIYTDVETLLQGIHSPGFVFEQISQLFTKGFLVDRKSFVTLAVLCLLFGAISQLILAFGENGFGQYGGTMFFICGAGICMRLFLHCYSLVGECLEAVCRFMTVLTPVYGMSILFADGMGAASMIYAALMGEITVFQMLLKSVCLPCTKLLLAFHFSNACTGQHLLKRLGRLLFDGTTFLMKGMLSLICGFNVVQALVAPGSEAVIQNGVKKAAMLLPGIGPVSSACFGMITGVAHALKNSIGAVGLLCVGLIFLPPLLSILGYLLAFRILEACLRPFATDSMVTMLTGAYESILLLFKVLIYAVTFVFVSLSILTMLT